MHFVVHSIGDSEAASPTPRDPVMHGQLSSLAGISLPPSLFEQLNDNDSIGIFFAIYNMPTLFPVKRSNNNRSTLTETKVGSRVLAASVGPPGTSFQNLSSPVTVVFQLSTEVREYCRQITGF